MAERQRPGRGWLSKAEMGGVFDVTEVQFDRSYRRFAQPTSIKEVGRALYFHCRTMLEAWAKGLAPKPESSDPLLSGGDESPNLERYRGAKAKLAELELEERRGKLISRAEVSLTVRSLTPVLRRAGEAIARKYGNDAVEILNQAIGEWDRGVDGILKEHDGPEQRDP